MNLRRAIPLAAVALIAALPASAAAATLTVDQACYRQGHKGAVASGTGFTPNAPVNFTLDGAPFTDPNNPPLADPAGNLNASFGLGTPPGKEKKYLLAASDGVNLAETSFTLTRLDVNVTPKRGNPGKRKRIVARGFDQGKVLRFHVRGPRRRNGKVGKAKGPCGKLKKKVRLFSSTYPSGVYTVQFDQKRRYKPGANPSVTFQVTIFRVFRPALASSSAFGGVSEVWKRID